MQITGPAKFWHYYQRVWAIISKIHKNSTSWIKRIGQKAKQISFTFRPGKPREKHNVVNTTYQSYAIETSIFRPPFSYSNYDKNKAPVLSIASPRARTRQCGTC
jgi:hypothetical protein